MIEMQKSFYVKVNNEIENYFSDEYLDRDYLEIYIDEFQPFNIDDIEWNKIIWNITFIFVTNFHFKHLLYNLILYLYA